MKEKKNSVASAKKKTKSGGGSARGLVLLLALTSLVALFYFVAQYFNNNSKVAASRATVDDQIALANDLNLNYFKTLRGEQGGVNKLEQGVRRFEAVLKDEKTGSGNMLAPSSAQMGVLNQVEKQWQALRGYFSELLGAQEAVNVVRESALGVSSMASEINLSASRVKNALDSFQNTRGISANLDKMMDASSRLDGLAQNLLSNDGENTVSAESINNQIEAFFNASNAVNRDVRARGAVAFTAATGNAEFEALNEKIAGLQKGLGDLSGYLPQFLQAGNAAPDIERQTNTLVDSLRELKETYNVTNSYPVEGLPLNHIQLMAALAAVALALLGIWVAMQIANGNRLNREATRLRVAAEERTKNDQEAILRLMDELAELSDGDLTIEAQVTEDFTGAIADSINFTVENMREMVGTITHTSDEITRATEVSQDVSRLLTESSGEQSNQIEESTQTVQKMALTLHEVAENTDASVDIARSSVNIAQEGRDRVRSTIKSMTDIRENIQETAKRIKRLGESSQEIGDIVEIIKGIADQTNVLALNAAIQATAAGEAGRGFAVVADEVQRLAERSANATKRIEVLVKTIQTDANEAVSSMENSTTQVVTGAGVAEEAGQSLDQIENVSQNLANLIVNVSKATRNAAGMAGNVAGSMGRLAELNEKAVQDVTTSVRSVDDLRELSTSLRDSVSGFKLPG